MSDRYEAVKRLKADLGRADPEAWGWMFIDASYDDLRVIFAALSHETERADLLQAAVLERTAERDALAERVRVLEGALNDVVSPLGKLQRDAEAKGRNLGGQAWDIANSRDFIQSIARSALSPSPLVEGGR